VDSVPALISNAALPTADQVIDRYVQALGGREAIAGLSTRVAKGVRTSSQGTDEAIETYTKEPDKTCIIRKSPFGTVTSVTVAQNSWNKTNDEPAQQIVDPTPAKPNRITFNLQSSIHLKDLYSQPTVKGEERLGDKAVYVVAAIDQDGAPATFRFDIDSGLLLGLTQNQPVLVMSLGKNGWITKGAVIEISTYYSDYRDLDGVKVAFRVNTVAQASVTTTVYKEIRHNVEIEDSRFVLGQ
jgi:hypothetical protein